MKTICILDTETTGVEPKKDTVLEIGVVLWSVEHKTIISAFSALCADPNVRENPAEAVNGIPSTIFKTAPPTASAWAWNEAGHLMGFADAIAAHSADFDRAFCAPFMTAPLATKPWICTQNDIEWPGLRRASSVDGQRERPGQSLVALALAHGLGVSHAHRALTDCMLLARLFERVHEMGHDVEAMLERGLRPKARFAVADTGFDPKRNELAKANGFRWDPDRKLWIRKMAIEDASKLPFRVREVAA